MALLVWYVMSKTATGYEMKLTGQNRRFAFFSGLKVDTLTIGAMTVSGAMCGLAGMFEVYGLKGSYQDGISNEFYFDGLLVAMIMGYNPVGIIGMSILFAVLRIGATGMELHAGVPGEIYRIIQSVIIFFMAGGRRQIGGKPWVIFSPPAYSGKCSAAPLPWGWRPWAD